MPNRIQGTGPGQVARLQTKLRQPSAPSKRGGSPSRRSTQGVNTRTLQRARLAPRLGGPRPMNRRQIRSAMSRVKSAARTKPQRSLQAASGLISRPTETIRDAARAAGSKRS